MGRRKIEIKAIKDDRNRSVTFLKRKGGLFKKAHELSVLCSVDVAVIIFGHNKKLYEFSSGDINETIGRYQYYGGAHEHKGPEDFMGKAEGDEDEEGDEDAGAQQQGSNSPPEQPMMMPHHLQNQQQFQHIRHTTPSGSPPMPNGMPFHHRASPQPQNISRPNSRAHIRRTSSNLAPPQPYPPQQPPPPQNGYAYRPNPPFYTGPPQGMAPQGPPGPPHPPQPQYTHPPSAHSQVQQVFMQDQRRQSMPPAFSQPQPEPPRQAPVVPSPPQPEQHNFQSPPMPQPKPLPAAAKNQSIFTPIDDSRSLLAQHWGPSTNTAEPIKYEHGPNMEPRPQSIDVASIGKQNHVSPQQPTPTSLPNQPQRTASTSSLPTIPPPTRTGSVATDAKRPRLKVQIPDEHSEAENTHASGSPKDPSTTGPTPARGSNETSHSSGVVLPPPSPSASALLSAGATGPPNPFARPAPPVNNANNGSSQHNRNENMETPISALPSRFMDGGLLPSPSSFYPEWGFGNNSSNMLPSPLTFQTPVVQNGPSFRDDPDERKRKTSEGSDSGASKRVKT
ncbi:Transcription factor MADS-box [Macrophomina phaseolina MS6]|uniref:Transcription factor MADS-box n=2 Tax=Macrophomina phaseolina TaxID=35725 RepID=K2RY92_MACPH|nr:Transcription factor MADS-box [Macrophomina phaseolina MS6]KAH7064578.1 SRF-type transcription factor RlmA [Macrophomina phaseolina]